MLNTKYKFRNDLKAGKTIKHALVATIVLIALLVASCGVIPGAKECNATVDSFMRAAVTKDVDTAYGLFCEGAKQTVTKKDIEDFVLGEYQLFEGYQDVTMKGIDVHYSGEGDTAEYNGEAKYADGSTAWIEAELVKEGDEWKLWGIWITPSE